MLLHLNFAFTRNAFKRKQEIYKYTCAKNGFARWDQSHMKQDADDNCQIGSIHILF